MKPKFISPPKMVKEESDGGCGCWVNKESGGGGGGCVSVAERKFQRYRFSIDDDDDDVLNEEFGDDSKIVDEEYQLV